MFLLILRVMFSFFQSLRFVLKIRAKFYNYFSELTDVNNLADTLFYKADADDSGAISFDEFYNILKPFINDLEIK